MSSEENVFDLSAWDEELYKNWDERILLLHNGFVAKPTFLMELAHTYRVKSFTIDSVGAMVECMLEHLLAQYVLYNGASIFNRTASEFFAAIRRGSYLHYNHLTRVFLLRDKDMRFKLYDKQGEVHWGELPLLSDPAIRGIELKAYRILYHEEYTPSEWFCC